MAEVNSKYYELVKIRPYRLVAIDRAVQDFKDKFGINSPPIDCVQLVLQMKAVRDLHIKIKSTPDLPNMVLGRTHYIRDIGLYMIAINRSQLYDSINKRVKYPFVYSSDRMVNFTLAHEFGHIFLGHAEIPDSDKTDEIKAEEELEANEFAGRLLLPEDLLFTCNYYSLESVAEHFLVSKTALLYRLSNMKRLDLLSSKKVRSCNRCGNTRFSAFAEYCGVCGQELRNNLRGIRKIHYPDVTPMDRYKRALVCPRCGKVIDTNSDNCPVCKTLLINYCSSYFSDKANDCSFANPGNARFCEMCGKPTYYLDQRVLSEWYVKGSLSP